MKVLLEKLFKMRAAVQAWFKDQKSSIKVRDRDVAQTLFNSALFGLMMKARSAYKEWEKKRDETSQKVVDSYQSNLKQVLGQMKPTEVTHFLNFHGNEVILSATKREYGVRRWDVGESLDFALGLQCIHDALIRTNAHWNTFLAFKGEGRGETWGEAMKRLRTLQTFIKMAQDFSVELTEGPSHETFKVLLKALDEKIGAANREVAGLEKRRREILGSVPEAWRPDTDQPSREKAERAAAEKLGLKYQERPVLGQVLSPREENIVQKPVPAVPTPTAPALSEAELKAAAQPPQAEKPAAPAPTPAPATPAALAASPLPPQGDKILNPKTPKGNGKGGSSKYGQKVAARKKVEAAK